MGSKSRVAKYIVPIIQKYIDDNEVTKYVEPFVGGANIIDKIHCQERYGFDKNKFLIALLKRAQQHQPLYDEVNKGLYDKARSAFNNGDTSEFEDWQIGNIGFLASYNGRYFDGGYAKPGYEKTKNGLRYRNYYLESKANLENQAAYLDGICFKDCDYNSAIELPYDSGMVIYCDPPYENTKRYANALQFDHQEFWDNMRLWSKYNIVLISEQNAPGDFECVWQQNVSRSIKATDKSKSTEKLFMYKNGLHKL